VLSLRRLLQGKTDTAGELSPYLCKGGSGAGTLAVALWIRQQYILKMPEKRQKRSPHLLTLVVVHIQTLQASRLIVTLQATGCDGRVS